MAVTAGQKVRAADLSTLVSDMNAVKRSWYAITPGADQTGIAAVADITGLSVTWTADSTRLYKTTINVNYAKATTANFASLHFTTGANAVILSRSTYMQIADYFTVELTWIEAGLSGSQTRKARADCTSGTLTVVNSFSRSGTIIVEDIGPA